MNLKKRILPKENNTLIASYQNQWLEDGLKDWKMEILSELNFFFFSIGDDGNSSLIVPFSTELKHRYKSLMPYNDTVLWFRY